jgi:hypothetical protein
MAENKKLSIISVLVVTKGPWTLHRFYDKIYERPWTEKLYRLKKSAKYLLIKSL